MQIASIVLVITFAGLQLPWVDASAQSSEQSVLEVKFANSVAESYSVKVNSNEKYTINVNYSWVRDDSSRYNLVSYSIDNGYSIDIPRKARGTFSLDIPMESDHTVTFVATIQYPISVSINAESSSAIRFNPSSATGDNWFDTDTNVAVIAPYHIVQQEQQSRHQLVAWSLDTSNLKEIMISDAGQSVPDEFSTPSIVIASPHNIEFFTTQQYYLNVISERGTVAGGGWYDSGSEAAVSVKPDTNGFPINHVFEGSDDAQWTQADGYSTTVLMDSPKTLVVKWKADYSLLLIGAIGAVIALAVTAVLIMKRRGGKMVLPQQTRPDVVEVSATASTITTVSSSTSSSALLQQEANIARTVDNNQRNNGDDYARDIMGFILTKSLETLESLHGSGLVPDSRIAVTRQKLEQSFG
jgi:hypothetical protein